MLFPLFREMCFKFGFFNKLPNAEYREIKILADFEEK